MKQKTLLMKVTSRERYSQMLRCVKAYIDFAHESNNMFWLFSFDEDDTSFDKINFNAFLKENSIIGKYIVGKSTGKINAINRDINLVELEQWDILVNISDDQFPIARGYDNMIRDNMPDDLNASLWFMDSYQDRINTQEILGRNYYINQGYIYHPSYKSLFCDNEATMVAERQGKLIKSKHCIIKHFHPCNAKEIQNDALYTRNEGFWNEDKANYEKRLQNNFE